MDSKDDKPKIKLLYLAMNRYDISQEYSVKKVIGLENTFLGQKLIWK